jgi:hypothetical protein
VTRRGRKDRRTLDFEFRTVGALYEHFGNVLPRETMVLAVRDAIAAFVPRDDTELDETRLQLVRKCEQTLRQLARSPEPAA